MPFESNEADPFIELLQEIEEEHLCDGLACPIALGRYLDGSPALFDLIQEGSLLSLSPGYPYTESQNALDSLILTNLQLKTQSQFFLCDSPWRDWAELYDLVPAVKAHGFSEQADDMFCLLAAARLTPKKARRMMLQQASLPSTQYSKAAVQSEALSIYRTLRRMESEGIFVLPSPWMRRNSSLQETSFPSFLSEYSSPQATIQ